MGIEEWIDEKIDKYDKVIKLNNEALSFAYSRAFLGENRTALKVIEDLQQLKASLPTQPELVEVPELVAEWIEHCRECSWDLRGAMSFLNMSKELKKWFLDGQGKNELFARAWMDSYTVKKEQLYYIALPLEGKKALYCERFIGSGSDAFFSTTYTPKELTEAEIKAIDERYWAFAVPVEEEE